MRFLVLSIVAGLLFTGFGFAPGAEPPPRDDVEIKDVMQEVMKGGLLRKAMKDDASLEDRMRVLDMFVSLSESEALKGDADEWNAATSDVLTSYAKFLVGREGGAEAVKAATNCKSCHDRFKPE